MQFAAGLRLTSPISTLRLSTGNCGTIIAEESAAWATYCCHMPGATGTLGKPAL